MCRERLVKDRVRFKDIYDNKHRSLVILEECDIVLLQNFNPRTKIHNRWHDSPYVVVSQSDNDIPVYVVKDIANGKMETCHCNQFLPLFKCTDLVKPTKQRYDVTPKLTSDICHSEDILIHM